jgi:hypothetical protein
VGGYVSALNRLDAWQVLLMMTCLSVMAASVSIGLWAAKDVKEEPDGESGE